MPRILGTLELIRALESGDKARIKRSCEILGELSPEEEAMLEASATEPRNNSDYEPDEIEDYYDSMPDQD